MSDMMKQYRPTHRSKKLVAITCRLFRLTETEFFNRKLHKCFRARKACYQILINHFGYSISQAARCLNQDHSTAVNALKRQNGITEADVIDILREFEKETKDEVRSTSILLSK